MHLINDTTVNEFEHNYRKTTAKHKSFAPGPPISVFKHKKTVFELHDQTHSNYLRFYFF